MESSHHGLQHFLILVHIVHIKLLTDALLLTMRHDHGVILLFVGKIVQHFAGSVIMKIPTKEKKDHGKNHESY